MRTCRRAARLRAAGADGPCREWRTRIDEEPHLGIVIVLVFGLIATVQAKNRAAVGETS